MTPRSKGQRSAPAICVSAQTRANTTQLFLASIPTLSRNVLQKPIDMHTFRLLNRLTDSSDRQLHKVFTELNIGDKQPSQFLRQMHALAESAITDDTLRVKWLDPPPPSVSRLLKIFKASNLDKQASELMSKDPSVYVVDVHQPQISSFAQINDDPIAKKQAPLYLELDKFISLTRQLVQGQANQQRSRSRSRGQNLLRGLSSNQPKLMQVSSSKCLCLSSTRLSGIMPFQQPGKLKKPRGRGLRYNPSTKSHASVRPEHLNQVSNRPWFGYFATP